MSPSSASVRPTISCAATLASGTPVAFDRYGTVRDARGFTSSTYTTSSLTANCVFISPMTFERARDAARVVANRRDVARRSSWNGGTTHELSPEWMPACSMCSMMPPMTTRARCVGERVDVDLRRVLEELVDEDRMLGRRLHGVAHVAIERRHVVDDRHRAAAEHVRRAHDDREADLVGDVARFVRRRRRAARRLRNAEIPRAASRTARGPRPGRSNRATCR